MISTLIHFVFQKLNGVIGSFIRFFNCERFFIVSCTYLGEKGARMFFEGSIQSNQFPSRKKITEFIISDLGYSTSVVVLSIKEIKYNEFKEYND